MTAINLQSFCARHDVREYLHQPFVIDGHTYASNGCIIVRVPGGGDGSDLPSKLVQSVHKMFAVEYNDFDPLPESLPAPVECDVCNGIGFYVPVDEKCEMCFGTGEMPQVVEIGYTSFRAHYVRMIAGLPNPRMSVLSLAGPAGFTFDGGEGRVMPYLHTLRRAAK